MAGELSIVDVEQVDGFAQVVDSIRWAGGEAPADLCAIMTAQGLGFLALSMRPNMATNDGTDIRAVLSFVDLFPDDAVMPVPRNLQMLANLTGEKTTVQHPFIAKGLGVLGGNIPEALASHYIKANRAAVRVIEINGLRAVYVDDEVSAARGLARHFFKMVLERARNNSDASQQGDAGTIREISKRALQLGDHQCAVMQLSPVNALWQATHIKPGIARKGHVLANGSAEPPLAALISIGWAKIPLSRKQLSDPLFQDK